MYTKKKRIKISYIVIVKKEDSKKCTSYKGFKRFKHRSIFYWLYKFYWRARDYIVEEYIDGIIN